MPRIIFHIDVNSAFLSWTAVKMVREGKPDIRLVGQKFARQLQIHKISLSLQKDSSKGNSFEGMTTLPSFLVRASLKSRYLTAFIFCAPRHLCSIEQSRR